MSSNEVIAVVLHFRTAQSTIECLASLQQEGVRTTVLVDNSEDNGASLSMMREELSQIQTGGMQVVVLAPGYNLGFAAGVNAGARKALSLGASQVLLLNSDARLAEGALRALIAQVTAEGGVAAPALLGSTGSSAGSVWYHTLSACMVHRRVPGSVPFLSGACLLMSAEVVEAVPFDESFFFYGEDVEFSLRLVQNDLALRRVPEAAVIHAGAGSARAGSLFYEYHTVRGHWLLALRLPRTVTGRLMACAMRFPVLGTRAAIRSLRSASMRPWVALWMASGDVLVGRVRSLTPSCHAASAPQDCPGKDRHAPLGHGESDR